MLWHLGIATFPDVTDTVGGVRLAPTAKSAPKAAPKRTNGAEGNGAASGLVDSGELLRFHRDMLLIRRFEERAGQLYGMGLIGGFCHLYIGQEAVVVGMQATIGANDAVVTSYRDHGHMLA